MGRMRAWKIFGEFVGESPIVQTGDLWAKVGDGVKG
jgi:hypothetical protein